MSTSTNPKNSNRKNATARKQATKPKSPTKPAPKNSSMMEQPKQLVNELTEQFRDLRMPMFREHFANLAEKATLESQSYIHYLSELTNLECQARHESRIARLMQQSRLPTTKTWENFNWTRLPLQVVRQMETLRDGAFLDRRENLLLFEWEQIFKDAMTTAAAIDRLVHHSIILELNVSSYRLDKAKEKDATKNK